MHAPTVRWSLESAPDGVEESVASYVAKRSPARFTGRTALPVRIWRMRRGRWFKGWHVFESALDREACQQELAVDEAGSGFLAAPSHR
jgi:hypothetical protein